MTARLDAERFFFKKLPTLAMSATIGNPDTFAHELGIKKFDHRIVPNQFAAETRRIEILDVPSMGHAATERDPLIWEKQAAEIAKAIHGLPNDWCGLILVTRKKEALLLSERIAKHDLAERVWVMPGADGSYVPTQMQVEAWNKRLEQVPNSICFSFSLWEGYDGRKEQFVILGKVPGRSSRTTMNAPGCCITTPSSCNARPIL